MKIIWNNLIANLVIYVKSLLSHYVLYNLKN